MTDSQILEFCIEWKVSPNQYMILDLVKRRQRGNLEGIEEYLAVNPLNPLELGVLTRKGMIKVRKFEGPLKLEYITLTQKFAEKVFDNTDMAEELWNAYPATFPLSTGGMFIARTGMSPDTLAEVYMAKIQSNPEKHREVMHQLERFIRLVHTGKINGRKLSDWVNEEMWETVASIPDDMNSPFKDDI